MALLMAKWWLLFMHPYFVSVTDINYNAAAKDLEISVRLFTDDFEKTLQTNYPKEKVDLTNTKEHARMDTLISRYIKSKLQLRVDNKSYQLQYVGYEKQEESVWCYFEIPALGSVKTIHISNRLLYDYKKEQINMHNITVGGERKSRKLDHPETEVDFSF